MNPIKTIKKKILKQYHIDDGELGGFIAMVRQSTFFFSIGTFVGVFLNAYHNFLNEYVSLPVGILIISIFGFCVLYMNYAFIQPSTKIFQNRQGYKHKNLIRDHLDRLKENDIDEIQNRLDRIEQKLDRIDTGDGKK